MTLSSRQLEIMNQLRTGLYIEVKDLANEFGVDVSTIRRDLHVLQESELIERLHGGARIRAQAVVPSHDVAEREGKGGRSTVPLLGSAIQAGQTQGVSTGVGVGAGGDGRTDEPTAAHVAVAKAARRIISDGDTLFLGSGRISQQLIPLLKNLKGLTIITNNLHIAYAVHENPGAQAVIIGGKVRKDTGIVEGLEAAEHTCTFKAKWAFVEADGIHPFAGVTTSKPWQVGVHRAMMLTAKRKIVMATSDSFGCRHAGFITDVATADLLITDERLQDLHMPDYAGKVVRGSYDPNAHFRYYLELGQSQ